MSDPRRIAVALLVASAAAWVWLAAAEQGLVSQAFCAMALGGLPIGGLPVGAGGWDLLLARNPPGALLGGWMVMVTAMMAPTLFDPLRHIHDRVLRRRRASAMAAFLIGYGAVWLAVGAGLLMAALLIKLLLPGATGLVFAAGLATVWHWSPAKQFCLNRCHHFPPLAAFAGRAERDAARFGLRRGLWCAASCWAMMLVPLLMTGGHVLAMAVIAIWVFDERMERPAAPRWRWRWPRILWRILQDRLPVPIRALRGDAR